MRLIPLDATPNQSLSVVLDGSFYQLTIKDAVGVPCMTITRDNVTIIEGIRMVAGELIVQPQWLLVGRNFFLQTLNGDVADFRNFGVNQFLFYIGDGDAP
jgi:hypothetical protein